MKILLTGASGLLGRTLINELESQDGGFEVTGTAFSRAGGNLVRLDLTEEQGVKALINDLRPELIIHAAAERRPDIVKDDPDKAERINIEATKTLTAAAEDCGAALLYISTNYVFDGTAPPYYPDSATNPLNAYGRMKLDGEKIVGSGCSRSIILRIPILYGEAEYLGESAVTLIAEGIKADEPSYFDNRMTRFPTHAGDISEVIRGLANRLGEGSEISGIYHCSSAVPYTKYSMARIMAEIMEIDPSLIREAAPDPNAAPRPENAKLDTGRLDKLGLGSYRDFREAAAEIIGKFR